MRVCVRVPCRMTDETAKVFGERPPQNMTRQDGVEPLTFVTAASVSLKTNLCSEMRSYRVYQLVLLL